ncbi:MAG: exodeoxyribonuclease VII large subunit [Nocardioides sp.]
MIDALERLDRDPTDRRDRGGARRRLASRIFCRSATRDSCAPCSRRRTPVVSAIGHEPDTPLLDLVADVRASTPTDAAKRVVPDVAEELAVGARGWRDRAAVPARQLVDRESQALSDAPLPCRRSADPRTTSLGARSVEVDDLRDRARRCWAMRSTGRPMRSPTS